MYALTPHATRRFLVRHALLTAAALFALPAGAQQDWPAVSPAATETIARISALPAVRQAIEAIRRDDEKLLAEQIEINEIPAPPFKEAARARDYLRRMQAAGLADARIDAEGNVIGVRKGSGRGPRMVVSAH